MATRLCSTSGVRSWRRRRGIARSGVWRVCVRTRLCTEVSNLTAEKMKQANELTRLKLHVQNTIAEQLTKAEEVEAKERGEA